MLILSRRPGEVIKIGDNVEVCVIAIEGRHVRLGVQAPREVPVHREEVHKRIQEENDNAGSY